ncbi:unnamed protein product [Parnassius apollo]|uniref:(apollo) hypothetical protein n=1 Tax=Parnassius apollo TaxID=110799 RepID=A0A8S3X8U6_PARAO|nr:unnamed protein product [Parnassius apollo]
MVKALPRSINDDNVITVELKRKLLQRKFCYKHGRKEQVRPEIIRRAVEYLVTCDLFRTYDIELEGSWTNNEPEDTVEYTCSSPERESNVDEIPDVNPGGSRRSEISAQEAIYVLTGLPLSGASEAAMYKNTSLPQERVHTLKSYLKLQSLEPDSSDIFQKGIIDYYSKRPLSLENINLSHFVAYYTYSKKTHSASSIETLNNSSQAIDYS